MWPWVWKGLRISFLKHEVKRLNGSLQYPVVTDNILSIIRLLREIGYIKPFNACSLSKMSC